MFSIQILRLIRFSVAGFNGFLFSSISILVIVLLQKLKVFFLQITVFLVWLCV